MLQPHELDEQVQAVRQKLARGGTVAAQTVRSLHSGSPQLMAVVVEGLLQQLRDPDAESRALAAAYLGDVRATAALPRLLEALEDPDREVCEEAALAVGKIGGKAAVGVLLATL